MQLSSPERRKNISSLREIKLFLLKNLKEISHMGHCFRAEFLILLYFTNLQNFKKGKSTQGS
jgi:hypothetical protein